MLEESLARADAQVRDAQQRLDVGLVPPSDVLTFEAQRSSEELQLIEARNQMESSLVDLRRLIGGAPEESIEVADPLDVPPGRCPRCRAVRKPPAWWTRRRKQRPELRALSLRFEGAQARQEAAATGRKPTVGLAGGYDFAKPNPKIFPARTSGKRRGTSAST